MKMELTFWPSSPTSENTYKETQNSNLKEYLHPYIPCSVIYNSRYLETAQVSTSVWVDKDLWYICTMEY